MALELLLASRRSERVFGEGELSLAAIGQLLWAGQGVTDASGHRTAPSAGAKYPLELYVATSDSVLHYVPATHEVERRADAESLGVLADSTFDQAFVSTAPAVLVITGVVVRTEEKYGGAAVDYMNREAGHVAQNVLLQATALGLAAVPVGGFDADEVARHLMLPGGEDPLYLIPVGPPLEG